MDKLGGETLISTKFNPNFQFLTIGGFAGTGKTFLISKIRDEINIKWKRLRVAFCAYTGKASSVLSIKLKENKVLLNDDFCGTIHSLMYKPEFHYDKKLNRMITTRWIKKEHLEDLFDLIFIDEASMVNEEIWKDLLGYKIPIIAVGDHGQLPPVGDQFNLMQNPKYVLTEIKRQSLENPIIRLSQDIRNGINIPFGFFDDGNKSIFKLKWNDKGCQDIFNNINLNDENIIILCGINKTRVTFNQMVRKKLGFIKEEVYPGERVICLKNNHSSKIMNGMLGTVRLFWYEAKNVYNMDVQMDGFNSPYNGIVYNGCFGKENYQEALAEIHNNKSLKITIKKSNFDRLDIFDFGYAISVHKAQASEWDKVIVIDEWARYDRDFYKRWIYTAVTRSKEKLFIISPYY